MKNFIVVLILLNFALSYGNVGRIKEVEGCSTLYSVSEQDHKTSGKVIFQDEAERACIDDGFLGWKVHDATWQGQNPYDASKCWAGIVICTDQPNS